MKRFLVIALFAFAATLIAQEPVEPAESGDHAAEGAGEPEEPSIVWKWINFAILAGGLGFLMAKTLPKAFATRTSEIQKNITEAQQIKREAEARAALMVARLETLGADIEAFRKQAGADMQFEGERIRQETVAQIAKMEAQAALEIESAGKLAQRELRRFSADLALKLAEERVRARLDAASHSALVDGFVATLERQESKN